MEKLPEINDDMIKEIVDVVAEIKEELASLIKYIILGWLQKSK